MGRSRQNMKKKVNIHVLGVKYEFFVCRRRIGVTQES